MEGRSGIRQKSGGDEKLIILYYKKEDIESLVTAINQLNMPILANADMLSKIKNIIESGKQGEIFEKEDKEEGDGVHREAVQQDKLAE